MIIINNKQRFGRNLRRTFDDIIMNINRIVDNKIFIMINGDEQNPVSTKICFAPSAMEGNDFGRICVFPLDCD